MPQTPIIPQTITVHLGPPDQNADNVTLPFLDYVANVASSEIYPTWPENAIRANMYAQISFALNRVYTEYYRTRGYDFDITSTTANDQFFVNGRDIFENIRQIAGELFDDYIRRGIQPDEKSKERIDKLHKQNLFKLELMPSFKVNPLDYYK